LRAAAGHPARELMPFTPFHMGAGLLGKGLAPKSQSLYFFAACNIAFDIEPGVRMLLGHENLHTITHNPVGLAASCRPSADTGSLEAPRAQSMASSDFCTASEMMPMIYFLSSPSTVRPSRRRSFFS
jgi:hypothetical protein